LTRQTVYAFIDSQNLNRSIQNNVSHKGAQIYTGWKLDFKKFRVYLRDKYSVSRAFLFIGFMDKHEGLYKMLEGFGYELIFKPTLTYINENGIETVKGNVDAELVLHAMIELPNYDKAIVVAGDGDYRCLLEYLDAQKKLGFVAIPNRYSFSSLLNDFRKYFIFISDLKTKLER